MKSTVIKQNVGIDISKNDFSVVFMYLLSDQRTKIKGSRKFANNPKGFEEFSIWFHKFKIKDLDLYFTMEATGVYYEDLAYFLYEKAHILHVVLPNAAKKFAQSYNQKHKTDKSDAKMLAVMGLERKLSPWKLSSTIFRRLKKLSRERERLINERTRLKNQLHAEEHSADKVKTLIRRIKNHINYINKLISGSEKEMKKIVSKDPFVAERIEKICTIPGISFLTAVTIIAETNGFVNISSIKQLVSYAGYDVKIQQSGKWIGKARITKKGNSHIRRALYMPAIATIQYTYKFRNFYERINEKKKSKLIGLTAVQRKLLAMIYTLWKNNCEYIDNYELKQVA